MNTLTQPCEYQECQCIVTGYVAGAAYCSKVCEGRDGTDEQMSVGCECGHPCCDAPD